MAGMMTEVGLENSVEIKRSKRLKGQPSLQGDGLAGFQALLLGALAEGPTRLENLPSTPWFKDILEDFIRMGYAQQSIDNQWVIHGGSAPVSGPEPLRVRHEAELLPLAAFLAAQNCQRTLSVDADCVSGEALEILEKILHLEKSPALENSDPETSGSEHFLFNAPTSLSPRTKALLHPTGSQSGNSSKPADLGWDEYLAKLTLLAYHLSVGKALDLSLTKTGPDLLESLAAQFESPLKIDRSDVQEGDELARRIARQMRAAGKSEPLVRLRLAAGSKPKPQTYSIPADITQASAFCLAATLIKGSDITLEGIPLNPSRAGFISALRRMGADIEVVSRRERQGEGLGVLRIRTADLIGKRFGADNISAMRDEVFLLMVAASFAEGETIIRDISHLRRHRNDLLKGFVGNLKTAGVEIGEIEDGLVIRGRPDYDGSAYDALGHPGLALACMVMGLKSHGASLIWGAKSLSARYPDILDQMATLGAGDKP
jgi:3-phosphoshikimate 1-carboxyvinyltransferase